jgi:prevent-host-death family protein
MKVITVPISEFKAKCLRLLDDVQTKGNRIVITKRGRPVAQVQPLETEQRPLRGIWKDSVAVVGDIVYFDASDDWESVS